MTNFIIALLARQRRRLVGAGIIIAIAVAAGWYWSRPEPVLIKVQAVERGPIEATAANTRAGTVKACRRAHLSLAMGGVIEKLPIQPGDKVKAGQLLLALWNHDISAEVQLAEREVAAARAKSGEACVAARVARREATRLVSLRRQNLVSEEQTERAVGEAEAREAACQAAQESSRVSEARLKVVQEALARTILLAPFDGTVAEINGELGEYVTPSPPGIPTPPAVDIIDDTCLYISAPIDEVDAPKVRIDMPARITLDVFPDKSFAGRVRRIAPYVLEVEKQARTVDVEAEFINTGDFGHLLPGYSADLEIILETRDDVLRIPTEALLPASGAGQRVLVFDPADDTLHERTIGTGISNWKYTEVSDGLQQGEQVVVTVDRAGVQPGAAARIE